MKFYIVLIAILFLFTCKKSDSEEDNINSGTFQEIFDKASNNNPVYYKLQPFELYSSFVDNNDSISEKVKNFIHFVNNTISIAEHPKYSETTLFKSTTQIINLLEKNEDKINYKEECSTIPMSNISYCTYSWTRNSGKLKVNLSWWNYPEHYTTFLNYDGTDVDGTTYKDETIQLWMTLKDLTASSYIYYSKFFDCDQKTKPLFKIDWWVEDNNARLCFGLGDCIFLTERYLSLTVFRCSNIYEYHISSYTVMVSYPDGNVEFYNYIYSYKIKDLYLWIVYKWFEREKKWCTVVFDENGKIEKNECDLSVFED